MYLIVCSVAYLEFQLRQNAGEFFQYIGDAKLLVVADVERLTAETLFYKPLRKRHIGVHDVINVDVIALICPVTADVEHMAARGAAVRIRNKPAPICISWAVDIAAAEHGYPHP